MTYITFKHAIVWIYKRSNIVEILNTQPQVKANINPKKQFFIKIMHSMDGSLIAAVVFAMFALLRVIIVILIHALEGYNLDNFWNLYWFR